MVASPRPEPSGNPQKADQTPSREVMVMAKPVGPRCNLDCKYCYYLRKEQLFAPNGPSCMPQDLLERYITQRIESSCSPIVHFEWHGGEPTLLGVDAFRRIVDLQRRHCPSGRSITNGIQTNGVLLDEPWAEFLSEEGFSVGLSLDGPEPVHDCYRVTKGQKPTHADAMRALRLLQSREVHTDVLCVLHAANVPYPEAVYGFFKDAGVRFLQFLPLVDPVGDRGAVSSRTARPKDVGAFLCAVFDEWVRRDPGRVVIQLFDEALRSACGLPHALCIFRESCGDAIVLEHDGSL